MTRTLKVVAVSGSLSQPSKTTTLVNGIVDALGRAIPIDARVITLTELGPSLAGIINRADLPPAALEELRHIETADVLIVATPVYRASFTGLFKHLFDFVDQYALVDVPVLLAASGGSERHSLIIEHQLRPLFGFFQAVTLPVGVYAHDSDFTGYEITAPLLQSRIEMAISRGLPLIRSNVAERDRIEQELTAGLRDDEPDTTAPPEKVVRLYS